MTVPAGAILGANNLNVKELPPPLLLNAASKLSSIENVGAEKSEISAIVEAPVASFGYS